MSSFDFLNTLRLCLPIADAHGEYSLYRLMTRLYQFREINTPLPPARTSSQYTEVIELMHKLMSLKVNDPLKDNLTLNNLQKKIVQAIDRHPVNLDLSFVKLALLVDIAEQNHVIAREYEKRTDKRSITMTPKYFNDTLRTAKEAIEYFETFKKIQKKTQPEQSAQRFYFAGLIFCANAYSILIQESIRRENDYDDINTKIMECLNILKEITSFTEEVEKNSNIMTFIYKNICAHLQGIRYILLQTVEKHESDKFTERFKPMAFIRREFASPHPVVHLSVSRKLAEVAIAFDRQGNIENGAKLLKEATNTFDFMVIEDEQLLKKPLEETSNIITVAENAHPLFVKLVAVADSIIETSPYKVTFKTPQEKHRAAIIIQILNLHQRVEETLKTTQPENLEQLKAYYDESLNAYYLATSYAEVQLEIFSKALSLKIKRALGEDDAVDFRQYLIEKSLGNFPIKKEQVKTLKAMLARKQVSSSDIDIALKIIIGVCNNLFEFPKKKVKAVQDGTKVATKSQKKKKKKHKQEAMVKSQPPKEVIAAPEEPFKKEALPAPAATVPSNSDSEEASDSPSELPEDRSSPSSVGSDDSNASSSYRLIEQTLPVVSQEHKSINKMITALFNTQQYPQLITYLQQYLVYFNEVNIATAFNRLSRVINAFDYARFDLEHVRILIHNLTVRALQLEQYSLFAVANIFDALANWQLMIGYEPYNSLVYKLMFQATQQNDYRGKTVSSIFRALLIWYPQLEHPQAKTLVSHIMQLDVDYSDLNFEGLGCLKQAQAQWQHIVSIPDDFPADLDSRTETASPAIQQNPCDSPTPR